MEKYLNKIEYNKILDNLQKHCKTYIGKKRNKNTTNVRN